MKRQEHKEKQQKIGDLKVLLPPVLKRKSIPKKPRLSEKRRPAPFAEKQKEAKQEYHSGKKMIASSKMEEIRLVAQPIVIYAFQKELLQYLFDIEKTFCIENQLNHKADQNFPAKDLQKMFDLGCDFLRHVFQRKYHSGKRETSLLAFFLWHKVIGAVGQSIEPRLTGFSRAINYLGACFLMSAKIEEYYPPSSSDAADFLNDFQPYTYQVEESPFQTASLVIEYEAELLRLNDYKIFTPPHLQYLSLLWAEMGRKDDTTTVLDKACYLMQSLYSQPDFFSFRPSVLAASCLYLSCSAKERLTLVDMLLSMSCSSTPFTKQSLLSTVNWINSYIQSMRSTGDKHKLKTAFPSEDKKGRFKEDISVSTAATGSTSSVAMSTSLSNILLPKSTTHTIYTSERKH